MTYNNNYTSSIYYCRKCKERYVDDTLYEGKCPNCGALRKESVESDLGE